MIENRRSYRAIFSTTSMFGLVQVTGTLFSIIKTKFTALLIGPEGMGIIGLLQTVLNLVGGLTNFGLETSAVRDLANAHAENKPSKTAEIIGVIRRLMIITGFLGAALIIIFSPLLSSWTFGNATYVLAFVLLSSSLLFKQLTAGNWVILQGLRKLKWLAKAQVWSGFFGLLTAVPLYYFFGVKGIVPALIAGALTTYLFSLHFVKKITFPFTLVNLKKALASGREMLGFGFLLGLGNLLKLLVAYLINIFISYRGGVDEVGLYQAGFIIVHSYVGLIFNAMGTDYYPRLAAVNQDMSKVRQVVSHQATAGVLFITPIIGLFFIAAPFIIQLLYAKNFTPVTVYLQWAVTGMFFKAVSFSMGYLILARADAKIYGKTLFMFNSIWLIMSFLGYFLDGLRGLGIAFLLYNFIHFLSIYFICRFRYKLTFLSDFRNVFIGCFMLCLLTLFSASVENIFWKYLLSGLLLLFTLIYCYVQLDKRINFKALIFEKRNLKMQK